MLKEQRQQYILNQVQREKVVSISDLSKSLGVSYMTVWRDLVFMESQGLLLRIRGGATSTLDDISSMDRVLPHFDPAYNLKNEKKSRIARYAAQNLVKPGENIIIEAGTTVSEIIPYLTQENLTILTNGLATSLIAAQFIPRITLLCSGGVLIETGAFIGPQAEAFFSQFSVNTVFFGAQGLTIENGFTDMTPLYTQLKNAMKQNAGQIVVLLDSTKWGVRSLTRVLTIEEVNIIVTDQDAPPDMVARLIAMGCDVHIAGVQDTAEG